MDHPKRFETLITEGPEVLVFIAIRFLEQAILGKKIEAHMEFKIPLDTDTDSVVDAKQMLFRAIGATSRFGVGRPLRNRKPTKSYWKWYYWWDAKVGSLTPRQIRDIAKTGKRVLVGLMSLDKLRPKGNWKTFKLVRGGG